MEHLDAVGLQSDNLAWAEVAHYLIVEVGEACCLAGYGISSFLLPDDDGRTAQEVAGGDDAVFGKDKNRAGAFDLLVDAVDAVLERVAHVDKQCHEFGLVNLVSAHLTEMHAQSKQLVGYLALVVNLSHRSHGISPKVRVDDNGLRVGIADDADALGACKFVQLVLELRAEIVALK